MSSSLTPEQQRQIEENRQRALARRAERLAQGNQQPVLAVTAAYKPCQTQSHPAAGGNAKYKPSFPPPKPAVSSAAHSVRQVGKQQPACGFVSRTMFLREQVPTVANSFQGKSS